jgi:Zn-dependent metalloprotease
MFARYISCALILVAASLAIPALAGVTNAEKGAIDAAVSALRQQHPNATVELNGRTGLPRTIKGLVSPELGLSADKPRATLQDVDQIVSTFFNDNQALFLQSGQATAIRITQKKLDPQLKGRAIARVQQTVKGIDIFGAEAALAIDLYAGDVADLTTTFVAPPNIDLKPEVNEDRARAIAKSAYAAEFAKHPDLSPTEQAVVGSDPVSAAHLTVFDPALLKIRDQKLQLAWLVKVGTFVFFINARDGAIVHRYRDFPSARTRLTYDANFGGNCPGTLVIKETGPVSSTDALPDDAGLAHASAGLTYDYYSKTFGRDSFDNNPAGGSALVSCVRYMQVKNAFWRTGQMLYGPGFAASLDVVGHEITHGVISHEAKLQYDGEPGAANEAFADFFGVMVAASKSGAIDWRIGVQIPGFSSEHPIRNMANPHNGGFAPLKPFSEVNQGQPDQYGDLVRANDPICANTLDVVNRCVHFNSGILDKAFYLSVAGGSGSNGSVVSGIGAEKVQQILYRTLTTNKLTSVAQFCDVATGTVEACKELASVGHTQITGTDCNSIGAAYQAVGIALKCVAEQ